MHRAVAGVLQRALHCVLCQTANWLPALAVCCSQFVYHNFLTIAECDHLVKIGQQRVSRSMVVDSKTGQSKLDDIRTSYGAAFG